MCVIPVVVLKCMCHSTIFIYLEAKETSPTNVRHHSKQGFTFLLTICSHLASSSVVNQFEVSITCAGYH